jgi:ankyrin repeat protein
MLTLLSASYLLVTRANSSTSNPREELEDLIAGIAEILLEGVEVVDIRNSKGRTPLIVASCNGHTKLVSILLDHGADAELQDDFGYKAIHEAASFGHVQVDDFWVNSVLSYADWTRANQSRGKCK